MKRPMSILAMLVLLLTGVSVQPAQAAESIPELQWPPVTAGSSNFPSGQITAPNGEVTLPCNTFTGDTDLRTWNASGQLVRQIPHTDQIDGVKNCISTPVVDKNGVLYGVPLGATSSGPWAFGPNLLAYNGNTLLWKYPVSCNYDISPRVVVGADDNVYAMTSGGHLIGLKPDLEPGQTQPVKFLDIQVPVDCRTKIYPYKDGLMLLGSGSGGAHFYSYSGKALVTTAANSSVDRINAAGELFGYSITGTTYSTMSITKYDPLMERTVWEHQASSQNAETNGAPELYPMPNGGVAAVITERSIFEPGPWHKTLVVLNSSGNVWRSVELPNNTTQGTFNTAMNVVADTSGRLTIIRGLNYETGVSSPSTVPAITIGVYDPVSDNWTYQQIMTGDMSKSGGPNGYDWNYSASGASVGNDTLFFTAMCTNNCSGNSQKLYAVDVTGLGVDYPRGDVLAANTTVQPTPIETSLLGDSYSSGQGAGDYDNGTVTDDNRCYKSADAYGQVLSRDPYSPVALKIFVACGGATTSDIYQTGTYLNVPPQNTTLSSTTRLVLISIGGNDIEFADVIITCADPTKDCDAAFALANNNLAMLGVKLETTYLDILQKAPEARVLVLGYPPIVTSGPGCNVGQPYPFFGESRKQKAVTLLDSLNATIKNSVNNVRALGPDYERLQYVDPMAADSPFIGRDVCSGDPYFHGITVPDVSESFHPNRKGQGGYATLVNNHLSLTRSARQLHGSLHLKGVPLRRVNSQGHLHLIAHFRESKYT